MQRRDFLLLRTERSRRVAELSCERLYMLYQQTLATQSGDPPVSSPFELDDDEPAAVFSERSTHELVEEVDRELARADTLRLVDRGWLKVDTPGFRPDIERLVARFRRRGGAVEYA